MKKFLLILLALCLLTSAIQAQTNTFTVTTPSSVTIQPAITTSTLTVERVTMDFQHQLMAIWFVGVPKPYLIKGTAFATLTATFQAKLGAGMATYLQANPAH
jgi:uncharacterized lipoprotein YajG